jgi:hypothetical protein
MEEKKTQYLVHYTRGYLHILLAELDQGDMYHMWRVDTVDKTSCSNNGKKSPSRVLWVVKKWVPETTLD